MAGTISNCNAANTSDTPFGDHDAGALRQKLNEFILAGAAVTTLRWRMGDETPWDGLTAAG
jgi:hypothetical protein